MTELIDIVIKTIYEQLLIGNNMVWIKKEIIEDVGGKNLFIEKLRKKGIRVINEKENKLYLGLELGGN